jgi:hypothetical protein
MELKFSQAYDIIEKAIYWNRSNPDFGYNAHRKPYILGIAAAALCDKLEDNSIEFRTKLVHLFVEAYNTYKITDDCSRREIEFDTDAFRNLIYKEFEKLQADLELYLEEEYSYINFILSGISKSGSNLFSDKLLDDLRVEGLKLSKGSKNVIVLAKIIVRSSDQYLVIYPYAILPGEEGYVQSIAIADKSDIKEIRNSIQELETMKLNYPKAIEIDKDFQPMLLDSAAWLAEIVSGDSYNYRDL